MEIEKDKLISAFAIFLIVIFASFMAYELYTSYMNIKSCENINIEGSIVVVFHTNVTIPEAYALINSTGGEITECGNEYIGNTSNSSEKALYFIIKVTPGEEDHYIEIYREKPEVYDAHLYKITC